MVAWVSFLQECRASLVAEPFSSILESHLCTHHTDLDFSSALPAVAVVPTKDKHERETTNKLWSVLSIDLSQSMQPALSAA